MLRTVLLAALAAVCVPRPAGACSCAYGDAIQMTPFGVPAPLNPVIRIRWSTRGDGPDPRAIELRPEPRDGTVYGPLEVSRRMIAIGEVAIVELRPVEPLAPGAYYEVVEGWRLIGVFGTSTQADVTAPTWSGIATVTYSDGEAVGSDCSTGEPHAVLALVDPAASTDDQTSTDDLVYGIWPDNGDFDRTAAPLVLVSASNGYLTIGAASRCNPSDFDFEKAARAVTPRSAKKAKRSRKAKKAKKQAALPEGAIPVYVAPIDDAGNLGAPARVVIDRSKPAAELP